VEPSVRLDSDVRENELRSNNLVIVGGPVVNMIASRVNLDGTNFSGSSGSGSFPSAYLMAISQLLAADRKTSL
jgi:hypothetical protein